MTETETGPKTVTTSFEGVIENAYGEKLSDCSYEEGKTPVSKLEFSGTYEALQNFESIPEKEMPDQKDILLFVNNARKANERQKAMQKVLDDAGVKKPTLKDKDFQIKSMIKVLVAAGKSEAVAKQIATQALA